MSRIRAVLITGATGFVGQHLLDEVASDGIELRILTRKAQPGFWAKNRSFKLYQGNLADVGSVVPAMHGVQAVINLAAELRDPGQFEKTNVLGTRNLISAAKEARVERLIHLSSVGVIGAQYSATRRVIDESTPCEPKNGYEASKLESERLLLASVPGAPYRLTILRPTNVFGEHHPFNSMLNFLAYLKKGRPFAFDHQAVMNCVYVKDLASAIRHFTLNDSNDRIMNVGPPTKFLEFTRICCSLLGVNPWLVPVSPAAFRLLASSPLPGAGRIQTRLRDLSNRVVFDDSVLRKHMPYTYGVRTGLERTIRYFTDKGLL